MNNDQLPNEQNDSLKSFLKEEIAAVRVRLNHLKDRIKKEDYSSLDAELNEKSETLDSLEEEDIQLFLLRREIGTLRESVDALTVKKGWWSSLPTSARIAIFIVPALIYFVWLSILQLANQDKIYDYPATQTVVAAQTAMPSPTITPTPIPTQVQ